MSSGIICPVGLLGLSIYIKVYSPPILSRKICGLNAKIENYEESLKVLHESGIPLVPHVLVGLHYGKIKGEFKSLEMIAKYSPSALVIIAFTPIPRTPMENVKPPSPQDIVRVLIAARHMFPFTPITLGCMRPKGEHRVKTDILAIKAGVNGIAFPVEEAINLANSMNMEVKFLPICCSQIFEGLLNH